MKYKTINDRGDLVTDYVANGSFKSIKDNVTYKRSKDYAILLRLLDYSNGFRSDFVYVDKKSYDFLSKSSVQPGDIIISNVGENLGTVFQAPDLGIPMTLGPNAILFKPSDDTNDYWYYWFSSEEGQAKLKSIVSSSAQPKFNKTSFRELSLPIIDKAERISIGDTLKLIDKKIHINLKINAVLDDIARLTFDYWFMQYDFSDKNRNPYRSSGGIMIEHEETERPIPKNWTVVAFKDLIAKSKNGDWGTSDKQEGKKRVFCIRGADINGLNGFGEFSPPVRYIDGSHADRLLSAQDLIIEISGGSPTQSTGRMALVSNNVVNRLEGDSVCSNFCKAVTLKNPYMSYFILQYWNRIYDASVLFNFESKTSGIKNLMFDQLSNDLKLIIPEDDILIREYYDLCDSLDKRKQANLSENTELNKLRSWIMPLLMTGQAKVQE